MRLLPERLKDKAFVIHRYPGEKKLRLIEIDPEKIVETRRIEQAGYYIAPFQTDDNKLITVFPDGFSEKSLIDPEELSGRNLANKLVINEIPPSLHKDKVSRAISLIESGQAEKIVVSSYWDAGIEQFDPFGSFARLNEHYPQSYVFYIRIPGAFSLMGASPEVLLKYEGREGIVYSLAGTKFRSQPREWTEKERHEQALVTDYIKRKLIAFKYPFNIDGPYDFTQGDLIHLRTDFLFFFEPSLKEIEKIIHSLHPTPAVAGLPKEKALSLISGIEQYDREFYTGFVGEIGEESGALYVNLRSVKIRDGIIRFYAGGGITKDSNPEAEWQEVLHKRDVLFKILSE